MGKDAGLLEIRAPIEAELDEILDVLNSAFDTWPGLGPNMEPREHLSWKCHNSPFSMDHHVVAIHEGRVGGFMLRIDRRVKLRNEVLPGQSGTDTCLIQRLQGRSLFSLMRQYGADHAEQRGIAVHLSFTRHPATTITWERRGLIRPRNRVSVLFRPINTMGAAGQLGGPAASLPRPVAAAGIWFVALASRLRHGRSKPPLDEGTIETIERFDASADVLWESASADFDFIAVRDRGYLNWRYCDRRGGDFTVRAEKDGDQLAGYCVLKFVGGRAYIADILVRSGRLDVVERLVWDATRLAKEHGADGLTCQSSDAHPYLKTFLRAGFFDTRRKADFAVVPLAIEPKLLDFLTRKDARIHVMPGDSDLV